MENTLLLISLKNLIGGVGMNEHDATEQAYMNGYKAGSIAILNTIISLLQTIREGFEYENKERDINDNR